MVEKSLYNMRRGGIYDHIGFGFHRYSTDKRWLVPHFEKMLYDQALMLLALSLMFEVTNDSYYEQTIDDVITYLVRDLKDNTGGFFSAEDADSDGEEGTFYVWSYDELGSLLTTAELNLISQLYQLDKNGNYDEYNNLIKLVSSPYNYQSKYDFQAIPEGYDDSYKTFCGT